MSNDGPATVGLSLRFRPPMDLSRTLRFLGRRAIPGVEHYDGATLSRTLRLPRGPGLVGIAVAASGRVSARLRLTDVRDRGAARTLVRQLLDLDADPAPIDAVLAAIPALAGSHTSGLRAPGAVDGFEMAVRAVLGQQISVAGARTLLGRLVAEHGSPAFADVPQWRLFPEPATIAAIDPVTLPMPAARGRTLVTLAGAMAAGELVLSPGVDRSATRERLLSLSGIGPWTADYLMMRATGDPDVFLGSDLGVRHALAAAHRAGRAVLDPQQAAPWRTYLTHSLWEGLSATAISEGSVPARKPSTRPAEMTAEPQTPGTDGT